MISSPCFSSPTNLLSAGENELIQGCGTIIESDNTNTGIVLTSANLIRRVRVMEEGYVVYENSLADNLKVGNCLFISEAIYFLAKFLREFLRPYNWIVPNSSILEVLLHLELQKIYLVSLEIGVSCHLYKCDGGFNFCFVSPQVFSFPLAITLPPGEGLIFILKSHLWHHVKYSYFFSAPN